MIPASELGFAVFALTQVLAFALTGLLSVLCFLAYYRTLRPHFRIATFGFLMVTTATAIEPLYQIGMNDYELRGLELLLVQSVESLLLIVGFGALFYSIYAYRPGRAVPDDETVLDPGINDD